jgi:uncharacterized integral membrane protein (TIGR00697 family)
MNEIFFLIQTLIVVCFAIFSARVGQHALTMLISINAVLANLFVVKQMELFGLTVTCSDVFAVGSIVALNLLQERFGKEAAKKTVQISFLCLLFFVFVSQIHLLYSPSLQDTAHGAFVQILKLTPRIVFASFAVFYLVQKFDVFFFGYLKALFNGKHLGVRMGLSLFTSQFLDTILFSFLGLYGIVTSIFDVILMSFAIKCIVIACSAPMATFAKRFFKKETV